MATQGVPGTAVVLATAGGILLFAGLRGMPLQEAVRSILRGDIPPREEKPAGASTTAARAALAAGASGAASGSGYGGSTVQASTGKVGSGAHPEIARRALTQLGVKYVWGGTSPKGFDCSGLVQWDLKGLGYVRVPRTTGTQQVWRALKTVPKSQMGAGDLVFWPGHVAIAINGREVVHAPRPGSVVRVAPVSEAGPPGYGFTVKRLVGGERVAAA